jgi:hypothetical protein
MIAALFGVLEQGLKLWNSKESTKYLDRVIKIKKEYYAELSKLEFDPSNESHLKMDGDAFRSQLALDRLMLELETICESFSSFPIKK